MKNSVITASKEIMGGAPVFAKTRVPIQTLIDYLKASKTIDDFLEGFPTVSLQSVGGEKRFGRRLLQTEKGTRRPARKTFAA